MLAHLGPNLQFPCVVKAIVRFDAFSGGDLGMVAASGGCHEGDGDMAHAPLRSIYKRSRQRHQGHG